MLTFLLLLTPAPARLPVAPPPRPMSYYRDEAGVLMPYAREFFDEWGVRRVRIHEGDPEFEWAIPQPGFGPEI